MIIPYLSSIASHDRPSKPKQVGRKRVWGRESETRAFSIGMNQFSNVVLNSSVQRPLWQ